MIGTSISINTTRVITYPSISVCSWNDPALIVDGESEWFESVDSYRTFEKTNISTPYITGRVPDLADMLYYILTKDAYGTRHLFYPAGFHGRKKMASIVESYKVQNPDLIVTLLEGTR